MSEQDPIPPVAEAVVATPEVTPQTISEVLTPSPEPAKPVNVVPESAFLNEKRDRKEAQKRVKELEDQIAAGATTTEVNSSISDLAKEFDIDPNFLDKLTKTIRSETEKELGDRLDSKFKPLEEKERLEKIDKAFNEHYSKAIESMPEFKEVVNPAVIKSLSLLPQNANKTFPQLIEETYGSAITGKRTLPNTTPGGGKDPQPLDYTRANTDKTYFKEVMADPKLKAEYNDRMLREGF